MDRQAPRQCHSPSRSRYACPFPVAGGKRDLEHAVFQLSAGIAAQQLLLQPAGEAAWHAAELYCAGDGDWGGRLLGWTLTLIGFVGLHRHSGQSGLK